MKMTQQISVQLVDDLDGSEASETIKFSLDGTEYEIDLNAANAGKFREVLRDYVSSARKTASRQPSGRSSKKADPHNAEIRQWAVRRGIEVRERGRVPAHVRSLYEAELH